MEVKHTIILSGMKTQSRYLQSGLSHMGRDHIGLSLPMYGTACPISSEQRQASGSSKV